METRKNILVVDDKPDNLRLLAKILTKEGYKVRKVLNGRLAVDAARLAPPDLILLDIMMPEPDGYQVCQSLKANLQTCEIPIIFLSALDAIADKVKAFTIGGVDYITKPFQQEEVLARVKTHLQIRQLNYTLQESNSHLRQEIKQRQSIEVALNKTLQELQTAQEQMIIKEKLAALGALMAGIAHELRNPLNFVNNYAEGTLELLQDILTEVEAVPNPPLTTLLALLSEVRDNAAAIHRHGQRATEIIQNMTQHARVEIGNRQLVNLNELLAEASALAYHGRWAQMADFNLTIHASYDDAIGQVEVASSDLSRALINLIDNACYAVREQQRLGAAFTPTLWITTKQLLDRVEIKIRDNGLGIEPEVQKKIFDPFFTTKSNEGTGLGLSMSYDVIVRQHQGTLSVNSELSIFTEFVVTIPA